MTPGDPLDSIFDSASNELRTQLGHGPVPDFEPNKQRAKPVAAIVAALVLVGAIGFTQLRDDNSDVRFTDDTETPDDGTSEDTAPDVPDAESSPDPTNPDETDPAPDQTSDGRDSEGLTIQPDDVELTFGTDASVPANEFTRSALGQSTNDPAYGTVVTRLTDASDRFDRIDHSHTQSVNADGRLLLTHRNDGGRSTMEVLDLESVSVIRTLAFDEDAAPVWHPTDPDLVRHLSGGNASTGSLRLFETNVRTGQSVVLVDFTDRAQAIAPNATYMMSGFGSNSMDGNRWAWMLLDATETPLAFVSYDLDSDTVVGSTLDIDPTGTEQPADLVSLDLLLDPGPPRTINVSPSGDHIVVDYLAVTLVYDSALTAWRPIPNQGDNSSLARQADGSDVYVYVDFVSQSPDAGFVVSVDLDTLDRTRLIDLFDNANTSILISGSGYDVPGWVVVSTYSCKEPDAWTCDKIMVVELGGEGRVVNLAHTYSCTSSFWAQPNATVDRSFSKIFFNSDAGSCSEAAEIYEIDVPPALRAIITE